MHTIDYTLQSIDFKDIESIRPLWEEHNAAHAEMSPHFGDYFKAMTFEKRKAEFQEKAVQGDLLIDLCVQPAAKETIGYCVSNLIKGIGEIDSLFVKKEHRGLGAGAKLVESAMAWMHSRGAADITVHVAVGNESALKFYRRFGLFPRLILLTRQCRPFSGED
jgi:diamine N-acetyltransferase